MSKVDFGRINAENEDFFSRKTQKNEGAKKGDEFLFDDEFDNKHVSNNERAGGDRFDHEHHVDPKEDMTTKNNVDDNTITLISDSDASLSSLLESLNSAGSLTLSNGDIDIDLLDNLLSTTVAINAITLDSLAALDPANYASSVAEKSADDINEIREYLLTLGDGESYTVTTTNEAGVEITTTYTLDGDNVVVTSNCSDYYTATYDSDGNLIEYTLGDKYATLNYSISRNSDGSVNEIIYTKTTGETITISGDGSKITIDYDKSDAAYSTTSDLYVNFRNHIKSMLEKGLIDENTYYNACEALANLVGYKGD